MKSERVEIVDKSTYVAYVTRTLGGVYSKKYSNPPAEELYEMPSGKWVQARSIGDGKVRLDIYAGCPCASGA